MAIPFKDLYKPWKDFNTKHFNTGRHKVELKHGDTEFNFSATPLTDPDVTVKAYCERCNTTIKAHGTPAGDFQLTTEWKDAAHGLKVTDVINFGSQHNGGWSVGAQYDVGSLIFNGEFASGSKKVASLAATAKLAAGWLVGGQALVPLGGDPSFTVGLRAGHQDFHFGAIATLKNLQAGLLWKDLGLELKLALDTFAHALALGWAGANAKIRAEVPTGLLQVAIRDETRKGVALTLSGEANVFTMSAAKWGANIAVDSAVL